MEYRKLGKTDLLLSTVGFGTWGIGGTRDGAVAYGETDDNTSLEALNIAFEQGITFYDTADLYGYGHAEELLGEAFEHKRDQVIIASKVGFVDFSGDQNFSAEYIEQALSKSLARLKSDYLDIYQLHSPDLTTFERWPELAQTLTKLKASGRIKAVGLAAKGPEDAMHFLKKFPFDVVQVNFNLADQRAQKIGLFDYCEKNQISIIARTPFCFGFLVQGDKPKQVYKSGDHRSKWSDEQVALWAKGFEQLSIENNINNQQSKALLALRFCLSYSVVVTVIPGIMNPKEAVENAKAGSMGVLDSKLLQQIEEAYQDHLFYAK